MKIKVFNRKFMDAQFSFGMLRIYYGEITGLLKRRAEDFQQSTDEMEEEHKKRQKPFNKEYWVKHYDVYQDLYPGMFKNSFLISACSLFEFHSQELCTVINEEHKLRIEWDAVKENVIRKIKMHLVFAGIELNDDPHGSSLYSLSTGITGEKMLTVNELWQELDYYFQVRNCLVHQYGIIQKLRYPDKVTKYADKKKIMLEKGGLSTLLLNDKFNMDVCYTMSRFFEKLMSAYYCTKLPE